MNIQQIGIVRNNVEEPQDPGKFSDVESFIELNEEYRDGLYRIEDNAYIQIIFYMHQRTKPVQLQHYNRMGEFKGVFATRTPNRPSSLGLTTVKVLEVTTLGIRVSGLDALNGTPVIDIKPFISSFDSKGGLYQSMVAGISHIPKENPRKWITEAVLAGDKTRLFHAAGQFHGHYCPGLALGIIFGTVGMKEIQKSTDGIMEDLIAIVEMNNCAADGIQFVAGCTLGNNSLIFEDVGKMALTLAIRDSKAIRLTIKNNWRQFLPSSEAYSNLFNKVVKERNASKEEIKKFRKLSRQVGFQMMQLDPKKIVKTATTDCNLPPRAPIHPEFICSKCGETTIGSRKMEYKNQEYCLKCSENGFYRLTGFGIDFLKK